MSNRIQRTLAAALVGTTIAAGAQAEVPDVATDIAPVHGLVARVMEGLGAPHLVVRPGASPHGYSMRPSEARALDRAQVVFWVGPELEPWLEGSIHTLAADAVIVTLLDAPETGTLTFREGTAFAPHAHDEAHDEHGDEDHDEAGHDDHDQDHAEDHDEDHADGHGEETAHAHDHDGIDPHAWLDPENAKAWLGIIAAELARLDPDNAERYAANATAGTAEIDAAMDDVRAMLAPVRDMRFVVFHDAYQYFESRFGISAVGAISLGDATDPGPARIEEIRETVTELDVTCVFSEPQFNQDLVRTVLDGTGGHSGTIDPLGTGIPTGPDFYPALIRAVGEEMAACGS